MVLHRRGHGHSGGRARIVAHREIHVVPRRGGELIGSVIARSPLAGGRVVHKVQILLLHGGKVHLVLCHVLEGVDELAECIGSRELGILLRVLK